MPLNDTSLHNNQIISTKIYGRNLPSPQEPYPNQNDLLASIKVENANNAHSRVSTHFGSALNRLQEIIVSTKVKIQDLVLKQVSSFTPRLNSRGEALLDDSGKIQWNKSTHISSNDHGIAQAVNINQAQQEQLDQLSDQIQDQLGIDLDPWKDTQGHLFGINEAFPHHTSATQTQNPAPTQATRFIEDVLREFQPRKETVLVDDPDHYPQFGKPNSVSKTVHFDRFEDRDFSHRDLSGVNFGTHNYANTKFIGTDLRGADLSQASGITPSQLREAIIDENTQLPWARPSSQRQSNRTRSTHTASSPRLLREAPQHDARATPARYRQNNQQSLSRNDPPGHYQSSRSAKYAQNNLNHRNNRPDPGNNRPDPDGYLRSAVSNDRPITEVQEQSAPVPLRHIESVLPNYQPRTTTVEVDDPDWYYQLGEAPKKDVTVHLDRFEDVNLSHKDLNHVHFSNHNYDKTKFDGTDLRGAILTEARNITPSQFTHAIFDETTQFPWPNPLVNQREAPSRITPSPSHQSSRLDGISTRFDARAFLPSTPTPAPTPRARRTRRTATSQQPAPAPAPAPAQRHTVEHQENSAEGGGRRVQFSFPETTPQTGKRRAVDALSDVAQIKRADLSNRTLVNLDFGTLDLSGASFDGSDVSGSDFSNTQGLVKEQFFHAVTDSNTRFPWSTEEATTSQTTDYSQYAQEFSALSQAGITADKEEAF